MKNNYSKVKLVSFIILSLIFNACSPSACDCANILSDKNEAWEKASQRALNGDGVINFDNDYWLNKGKSCMEQYTDMKQWEIETYQSMGRLIADEAIENATKECATKKDFKTSDLEIACDCWNQSVEKSGMAYDDMNTQQKEFREKCFEIFKDEYSMEQACKEKSKK